MCPLLLFHYIYREQSHIWRLILNESLFTAILAARELPFFPTQVSLSCLSGFFNFSFMFAFIFHIICISLATGVKLKCLLNFSTADLAGNFISFSFFLKGRDYPLGLFSFYVNKKNSSSFLHLLCKRLKMKVKVLMSSWFWSGAL